MKDKERLDKIEEECKIRLIFPRVVLHREDMRWLLDVARGVVREVPEEITRADTEYALRQVAERAREETAQALERLRVENARHHETILARERTIVLQEKALRIVRDENGTLQKEVARVSDLLRMALMRK